MNLFITRTIRFHLCLLSWMFHWKFHRRWTRTNDFALLKAWIQRINQSNSRMAFAEFLSLQRLSNKQESICLLSELIILDGCRILQESLNSTVYKVEIKGKHKLHPYFIRTQALLYYVSQLFSLKSKIHNLIWMFCLWICFYCSKAYNN